MRVQSEITVNRSLEEVFAIMTDVTNTAKWAAAAEKEWWVTPPPHGVGSVRRAVGRAWGRPFQNDASVVEYDPPRRRVMAGEMSGNKFQVAIDFAPVAGGKALEGRASVSCRAEAQVSLPEAA